MTRLERPVQATGRDLARIKRLLLGGRFRDTILARGRGSRGANGEGDLFGAFKPFLESVVGFGHRDQVGDAIDGG